MSHRPYSSRRMRLRRAYARQLDAAGAVTCPYCGDPVTPNQRWDLDHAIPVRLGGSDDPSNLRIAHADCNRRNVAAVPPPSREW